MRETQNKPRPLRSGVLTSALTRPQGKKAELKHYIIDLSKQFSILSQFTSFVAVEERVCAARPVRFLPGPKLPGRPATLNSVSF